MTSPYVDLSMRAPLGKQERNPTLCRDCGGRDALDTTLFREQWDRVCPEGGVLCASCIVNRAGDLPGVIGVFMRIMTAKDYDTMIEHKDPATGATPCHPAVLKSSCPLCTTPAPHQEPRDA